MFCDQCGKQTLRSTSKFCSFCGTEFPISSSGDTPVTAAEDTQSSAPESPSGFQRGEQFRGGSGSRGAGRLIRRQQRQQLRDARSESVGDDDLRDNNDESGSTEPGPRENPDNQGWQQYIPRSLWNSDLLREYREHVQKTREEKEEDKKAQSKMWDNPIIFIGLPLFVVGWVWAVVICFGHSTDWFIRFISIGTAPALMLFWGEWAPLLVVVPGSVLWMVGVVLGRRPTFWRMSLAVLFILSIYFLPLGVGLLRNKRAKLALFIVNLIAGWTAIIWIIALIWALIPRTGDTTVPVINSRD